MTTYALVIDNQIEAVGSLPNSARRLDTGDWVMGLDTAPPDLVAATGWTEVVDTARPADTATTTHDRSVTLVAGVPTVTWASRTKTAEEQAGDTRQANRTAIEDAARTAMANLQTIIDSADVTFTTVAGAQTAMRQIQAGLRTVARVERRLIRLALNDLDGTA